MRKAFLTVAVIGLFVNVDFAYDKGDQAPQEAAPAAEEKHSARSFNSALSLLVWAKAGGEPVRNLLGRTPAATALAIPEAIEWRVEPIGPVEMDALAHLKDLTTLQTLNLRDARVTDAGLAHVKGLKGLQALGIARTQVTDAGAAHLKELKHLHTLDVRRTQLTDAGAAQFKEMKSLRKLNLRYTQVTDPGAAELRKALPLCTIYR